MQSFSVVGRPTRLLFTPQLNAGDGPRAFLRRVGDENGLALRWLECAGVRFERGSLAQLGYDLASGEVAEYVDRVARSLTAFPGAWLRKLSRYCPACLKSGGRWRADWELRFADACAIHGVWLVDRCDCGNRLDWARPHISICRCGRPIANAIPAPCPDAVVALTKSVVDAALGHQGRKAHLPLTGLDLNGVQRVILLLGHRASQGTLPSSRRRLCADAMDVSWNITSLAAEALADWPETFLRMLENHVHAVRWTKDSGGLTTTFGALYRQLYVRKPPEFDAIRVAFEQYLAEHWRGALGRRNTRLSSGTLERAAWKPLAQVARQLHVAPVVALRELKRSGALLAHRKSRSGRSYTVASRIELTAVEAMPKGRLTLAEAAKELGLPKRRLRDLAKAQILPANRTGGFTSSWSLHGADLARILTIVSEAPLARHQPADTVRIGHILRYWACSDDLARDLISALIEGRLQVLGRVESHVGFSSLLVNAQQMRTFRNEFVAHRLAERVAVPEAAQQLGVKQEVAYHLIRRGLLAASMAGLGASRRQSVVVPAAVETFRARYALARDLAKSYGRSPKALIADLRERGVTPIAGPDVDGCRQVIFLQNDVLVRTLQGAATRTRSSLKGEQSL